MSQVFVGVPVAFGVGVPHQHFEVLPVIWGKGGSKVKVIVTSEKIVTAWTHFIEGRTRPCYSPVAICNGCLKGYPRFWKAWLGAVDWYTHNRVIVMLTDTAVKPHAARMDGIGVGIRGYIMTILHDGDSPHGRTFVEFSDRPHFGVIPPAFDVESHLKHMWSLAAARTPPNSDDRWEMLPVEKD